LRNSAAILILPFCSALIAQTTRVPFVGCAQDGQAGPVEAPKGTDVPVEVEPRVARRLAFYSSGGGFGVLAPRGWYCFGFYGSSGGPLFVSPRPIRAGDLFPMVGPEVELDAIEGSGSGTGMAAEVWARVFPAFWPIVKGLISNGDLPAGEYTFGPYPKDKLIAQTERIVQFQTPPHSEGLGTMSHFKPDDDPIDGVAILEGQTPNLLMLRVRLPRELRDLAPIIIRQMEREHK
jgi:hypothetical protein